MEEINRSRRQLRRVPRADVQHGHALAPRLRGSRSARYLPQIASGELRLQSMAVTEPSTGSDTTKITTTAVRKGDRYVINGQKVWISRVQHSDLMILLARTTPLARGEEEVGGHVDLPRRPARCDRQRPDGSADRATWSTTRPTSCSSRTSRSRPRTSSATRARGFKYILDGLNAERTLIAAECIGDGYWFIERVTQYANERVVFGRPIGQNQGVQFPIAQAYIEIEAANLMRWRACELFDARMAVRRGGEHGEVPRRQGVVGSGATPACSSTAASASRTSTTSSASSARRGSIRWRRFRPT